MTLLQYNVLYTSQSSAIKDNYDLSDSTAAFA
jgi:hypothetical protein